MKKIALLLLVIFSIFWFSACENKTEALPEEQIIVSNVESVAEEPASVTEPNETSADEVITETQVAQGGETVTEDEVTTCSLSVICSSILEKEDKKDDFDFLPENGIIYSKTDIAFQDGETVFDILERELASNGIEFDYSKLPFYDPVYIKGIANLYEFDGGPNSGWLYRVNGTKPNYPCSEYTVKHNDNIEIIYTCNYLKEK